MRYELSPEPKISSSFFSRNPLKLKVKLCIFTKKYYIHYIFVEENTCHHLFKYFY
jgi:hypothetical protein